MRDDEQTLEIHKLIVGETEIEAESSGTISEYLIERAAFKANQLGRNRYKLKQFDIVQDAMSKGWVLVFMCERWF